MDIRTVGVVGAGTMGNGIAQTFAAGGYNVVMSDVNEEYAKRGFETIRKSLDRLVSREKISAADRDAALARIRTTTSMEAFADSDLIVEAALEKVELKQKL